MADDNLFKIEKDELIYPGKNKKGGSRDTLDDNSIEEAMSRVDPESLEEIARDFENEFESVTTQAEDEIPDVMERSRINTDFLSRISRTSDPQDLRDKDTFEWDTSYNMSSMFEGKLLDPLGFEAVVDAVNTAYWNPSELNSWTGGRGSELKTRLGDRSYGEVRSSPSWEINPDQKINTYRGQAGELSAEELFVGADASYRTANDAHPVSRMAQGVLLHAAQILKNYGAETEGDEIRIEDLDAEDAEEVVQAYTFVDSLLESDDWDPRTVMERMGYEPRGLDDYNLDKEDYISDEL